MRFESPEYLILLLLVPLMYIVRWWMFLRRRKKMRLWGDIELMRQQMPDLSKHRPMVKFSLVMSIIALLIVMLSRPQMGTKVSNEKRNGIEAIICLDISNSMLAEDVAPSRLDKSKMLVENLVDHFVNDKVGLVVFAGDAFTQLPITSDYVSAKMFLQNSTPELIQEQGTDIAKAIDIASQSFTKQEKIGRAIVIITDGEDHEGGTMEAAKEAYKKGIKVFVLGIGSPNGAPIPVGDGSYMTDNAGNTVMTRLNEGMCKEIADAGHGTYIHVDNTSDAQKKLDDALSGLQRSDIKNVVYSEYGEQFQIIGFIAILLLVIEVFISERKTDLQKRMRLFKRSSVVLLFIILALGQANAQNSDRDHIRSGNRNYRIQKFDKSIGEYEKAIAKNSGNATAHYNLACARMAQADLADTPQEVLRLDSIALSEFDKCVKLPSLDKRRTADAYHNIGVINQNFSNMFKKEYQNDALKQAIAAYRQALRLDPTDYETRYNLSVCQRKLKQNQQNQQKKDDKKNDDKKDKKQDQQENKQNQNKDNKQQNQDQKMSKDNAEQLLNAAMQQEKATQQRLKQSQQQRRQHQNNW